MSVMEPTKVTPMMQQYLQIKERYRDAILFFRLGDFYEMFFEDAQTAAKILDIALTSRNKSEDSSVPLCGVPYHSAEPYIQKLLDAGHKVAVCEQIEDPKSAKGVVQREVVRVITPGTITAAEALDGRGNNFLAAVCQAQHGYGLALTDITTGEFRVTQLTDESSFIDEINRVKPSELLAPDNDKRLCERLQKQFPAIHLTAVAGESFSASAAGRLSAEAAAPAQDWQQGIRSASAIVAYLENNAPESLKLLRDFRPYGAANYLVLDETTRVNLELIANVRTHSAPAGDERLSPPRHSVSLSAAFSREAPAKSGSGPRQIVGRIVPPPRSALQCHVGYRYDDVEHGAPIFGPPGQLRQAI